MATIETKRIRNVALLGHSGCGKTSLAEAMLFISGGTDRLGKIADGNTVCDFDPEEIKRGYSISAATAPMLWNGTKINILDTPGFFDFEAEVKQALGATPYTTHKYIYEHPSEIEKRIKAAAEGQEVPPSPSDLSPLLEGQDSSLFVILAATEVEVDRILAALASASISPLLGSAIITARFFAPFSA